MTFRIKSSILTMLLILRKLNPLLLPTSVAMLSVKVGKLEADNGKVQYEVTIYHNDETDGLVQQGVIIDAVSGDIITRTLPEKVIIPDEEDDGFILWVNNSYKAESAHCIMCTFFIFIYRLWRFMMVVYGLLQSTL